MEIRVLRYFLAVAREETITGAANFLHVTQPTLSRKRKDLEDELGQKLLIRGSHRVTLTPEGMLLRKRAEEIISMAGETDAMNLIAAICHDLQKSYPGIHYHLYSGNAEDITERLDKGLLYFGILIQPTDITKYNYLSIPAKDTWGVIMRKDSLLAEKEEIQVQDLLDLPLIFSRQAMQQRLERNELADWFGDEWDNLNIVTTFNFFIMQQLWQSRESDML